MFKKLWELVFGPRETVIYSVGTIGDSKFTVVTYRGKFPPTQEQIQKFKESD